MSKHIYKSDSGYGSFTAGVSSGGTSGSTAAQAADRLGLLTNDMLGVEKGLLTLETVDGSLVIPTESISDDFEANRISVRGLIQIDVNTQMIYTIVNYDSFTKYTVAAINGSVDSVNGPEIRYTTPPTPGECGFTINGQKVLLRTVGGAYVNAPSITVPANMAINMGPDVTIQTSPFQTTGGVDTHQSTDYHIAEDPGFENGFVAYSNQITGRTSFLIPNLNAVKTYYVRARHRGDTLSVSGWSATVAFTTKTEYKPNKPSITSPVNGQEGLGPNLTATSSAYSLTGSESSTLTGVEWQLSKVVGFTNLIQPTSMSGLNAVWNAIEYASTYFLRVRHVSSIGTSPSDWSDVISFMSGAIPNPNTPTITAPVGEQDIDLILLSDPYHSDVGETHVSSTWQVSTDANFNTIVTSKSVVNSTTHLTSYTLTGLNLATTYYVRVAYKSDQGRQSAFSAPVSFLTQGSVIAKPSITFVSGVDPYLNVLASYYNANDSAGAVSRIHWQVYTSVDFTTGMIYDSEDAYSAVSNPVLSGLYAPPGANYYVRMQYKSANGFYSAFSDPISSGLKTYMSVPTLGTATLNSGVSVTFTWNKGANTIPGVTTDYKLITSTSVDFTTGVFNYDNLTSLTLTATLDYGNIYYWKVEQTDTDTVSGYTETRSSSVGDISIGAEPPVVYTVNSTSVSYNEGDTVSFTLIKSRADASGDFYTLSGTAGNSSDVNYPLQGSLTFGSGNDAEIVIDVPTITDSLTDGDKTLTLEWRTGSVSGPVVGSKTVNLLDTSLSPNPSIATPVLSISSGATGPYVSFSASEYSGNTAAGNAVNAQWVISTDPTLATNIIISETIAYNGIGPAVWQNKYLPAGITYYAGVHYTSDNGTNSFVSNVVSITVSLDYVNKPTLNNPTYGLANVDTSVAFEWSPGSHLFSNPTGVSFNLRVWRTSDNLQVINQNTGSGTVYNASGLEYNTEYGWDVTQTQTDETVVGSPVTVSRLSDPSVFTTKVDPLTGIPFTLSIVQQTFTIPGSGGEPEFTGPVPGGYDVTTPQVLSDNLSGTACVLIAVNAANSIMLSQNLTLQTTPTNTSMVVTGEDGSTTATYYVIGHFELRRVSDNLLLAISGNANFHIVGTSPGQV